VSLFALDTNTVSYFLRDQGRVTERFFEVGRTAIALPAVVVYELQYGAGRAAAPRSLVARLDEFLANVRVLPFDRDAAQAAARVRLALERAGASIGPADVLVAGSALAHHATLVTRNVTEFRRVPGLRVVDWY
jgi:tRNA(fMet)-specific endonuclease VapC